MNKGQVISIADGFKRTVFRGDRTPGADIGEAFCELSDYRGDGSIFLANYAGNSEWERHGKDEVVMVIEGYTTLFLLENGEETGHRMEAGELIVVPEMIWHRFESPDPVRILSITPLPEEHSVERPE